MKDLIKDLLHEVNDFIELSLTIYNFKLLIFVLISPTSNIQFFFVFCDMIGRFTFLYPMLIYTNKQMNC